MMFPLLRKTKRILAVNEVEECHSEKEFFFGVGLLGGILLLCLIRGTFV